MQIWDVPKELVPAGHCSEILPLAAGAQPAAACCPVRACHAAAFCGSGCLVSFFLLAPSPHPVLRSLPSQHHGSPLLGSDHEQSPAQGHVAVALAATQPCGHTCGTPSRSCTRRGCGGGSGWCLPGPLPPPDLHLAEPTSSSAFSPIKTVATPGPR